MHGTLKSISRNLKLQNYQQAYSIECRCRLKLSKYVKEQVKLTFIRKHFHVWQNAKIESSNTLYLFKIVMIMYASSIELRINYLFQIWRTDYSYPIVPLFISRCTFILSHLMEMIFCERRPIIYFLLIRRLSLHTMYKSRKTFSKINERCLYFAIWEISF